MSIKCPSADTCIFTKICYGYLHIVLFFRRSCRNASLIELCIKLSLDKIAFSSFMYFQKPRYIQIIIVYFHIKIKLFFMKTRHFEQLSLLCSNVSGGNWFPDLFMLCWVYKKRVYKNRRRWYSIGRNIIHNRTTDQQQAWMKKIGSHLEDMVTLNREHILLMLQKCAAYNVTKSFHQVYPEVETDYRLYREGTGIKPDDIRID